MPNVKSAIKRHRTSLIRNERNRKRRSTMRTLIKKIRSAGDSKSAEELLPKVFSSIDKNVKVGVLHKRTAARYKARLSKFATGLSAPEAEK
ncbi:MAG: 30S ribosomal protein S20 [Gemmatimonadota bacterium]|nr:30S ribosomal protein S20 [Gemmatimonadota bacterium]